ncbi:hypothetical protein MANES_11G103601v8 [Manihot esculenta]|uniref:Uncharacterized protein n=1 Tax=Manihot esculenta TaxID=3983 RepID=A0ACB7GWL9_MANES|nr:hypothetical protein MANES_11G103601v8 [Manihot esculenta]
MQPPNSVKLNLKSNEVMDMQTKVLVGTYMILKDEIIWTAYWVSLLTPSATGIPIRFEQSHVQEVIKMMEIEIGGGWIFHKLCKVCVGKKTCKIEVS